MKPLASLPSTNRESSQSPTLRAVAGAPDLLRRFYAGDLDLRSLLLESSVDGWYTALVDDDFERPVSLEPQQGQLLEMDYLPEAGFRLGKTPADDLMSANPN